MKYYAAEAEVIVFSTRDIIQTSDNQIINDGASPVPDSWEDKLLGQ